MKMDRRLLKIEGRLQWTEMEDCMTRDSTQNVTIREQQMVIKNSGTTATIHQLG